MNNSFFKVNYNILLCASMIIISYIVHFSTYLASDLGWHLHVASGMLDGKKLYVDFFEVNPPLVFYITIISVLISKILNLNLVLGLNIFNFLLCIVSLLICINIIRKSNMVFANILNVFVTYALFILPLTFPTTEFGQKEHLFMIFFMPYFLNFTLLKNSTNFQLLSASLALLLKPFFLIAMVGIWGIKIFKKDRSIFKEIAFVALSQIIFGLIIIFVHPNYLNEIIPIALISYKNLNLSDGTLVSSFKFFYMATIFTAFIYLLPVILSLPTVSYMMARLIPIILMLLCSIFIQGKFFWYHYIPLLSVIIIYYGLSFINYRNVPSKRQYLQIVNLVVMIGCLIGASTQMMATYKNKNNIIKNAFGETFEFLKNYEGERVMMLCPHISPIFPITNYLNFKWDMKQHSMQILDGVYKFPNLLQDKSIAINYVVEDVINALSQYPKIVLVRKSTWRETASEWSMYYFFKADLNYIDYFSKYDDFKKLWQHYLLKTEIGNDFATYYVYERI